MNHPLTCTPRPTVEQRAQIVNALAANPDLSDLLLVIAAERLAMLESVGGMNPSDPNLPRMQGRCEGYAWVIGLFNQNEDEE